MIDPLAGVPGNTPVIVGAGQYVERLADDARPPFNPPCELAAIAARRALADAGIGAGEIDHITMIRLFADSAKAWRGPFGGSDNPPESVARRIGAPAGGRVYSQPGGSEPLQRLMELCLAIGRGEIRTALITGAEAIATERFARRRGLRDDWNETLAAPMDDRGYGERMVSRAEMKSGMTMPAHYYALIENRQAFVLGQDAAAHRVYMGELMAPFSAVAAANPFAQQPVAYPPQALATVSDDNYPVSLPLTRRLVASDAVSQSAAVLITSAERARALGIDPANRVFLAGYAEGQDRYLTQREEPARSEAMQRVFRAALAMAGAEAADMSHIDLYSCFPCAVHAAVEALGLPPDGARPLTVTGGLPFFGGPGNNYSLHAVAEMARRLRGGDARGLVTANGGFLSKHAAAVFTAEASRAAGVDWGRYTPAVIDPGSIPELPLCAAPEEGVVLTWTVIARRDAPDLAMVMGECAGGRFLAGSEDPATVASLCRGDPIGRRIAVTPRGESFTFSLPDQSPSPRHPV